MTEKLANKKRKRQTTGKILVNAEAMLREREVQLETELADTKLLQAISAEIAHEENIEGLYQKLVDGAVAIMRSDFASMQMFYPERGSRGELRLLAFRGFNPEAAKFWEWVRADSGCTCGKALNTGERVIVPDVEKCDFMASTPDLAALLQTGIHAAQTTPLFSRGGKLVGMISTHWRRPHQPAERQLRLLDILARQAADLIERKQAEEVMARMNAESEQERRLYRTILSNTPDLVYVFDLNHRFIYANDALLAMWGRTRDEAFGKNCLELGYEPWHAAMHDREIEQVIATRQSIRGEVPFTGTNGRRIYDYIFVPVLNAKGEVEAIAGTTRDITDRKQAEEALRQNEERLRAVFNSAAVGVALLTPDARFLQVNATFCSITGYSAAELCELNCAAITHPDDGVQMRALLGNLLAGSTSSFIIEKRYFRKDGTLISVQCSVSLARDHAGVPSHLVVLCQDITERKRAQEMLKAADRRKDEFLATLSHELRNPLAPIRQAAKLLQAPGISERDAHWARAVIDRQVRAMGWLLDDLLDLSRISSGKLELRKEPVDLASAVESALELSRPLIDAKQHTLHIELPVLPVRLEADPLRLAQIISNLLTNAAKYTDPKGRIRLWARPEGQELLLRVTDNGIGISADMLPKVFEMFSQAKPALERTEGGLGIGLALVRGFVTLHGGSVQARSAGPGRGSEFTLRLPLGTVTFGHAKIQQPAITDIQPVAGRKVLVVDDNRDMAETLASLISIQGYDVRSSFNGREALEVAETFHPDIVLLDIGMPELNGYEIAQHIRQRLWGQRITLVAVTGWGQEDDKRRALAAGFDAHLRKPIDPDFLQALLKDPQIKPVPSLSRT